MQPEERGNTFFADPLRGGRFCPSSILPSIPLPTLISTVLIPSQDSDGPLPEMFFDPDTISLIIFFQDCILVEPDSLVYYRVVLYHD